MSEWQPIVTAPQDGTRIICWALVFGSPGYTDDSWQAIFCRHNGDRLMISQPTGGHYEGFKATHWMPLPEPPK